MLVLLLNPEARLIIAKVLVFFGNQVRFGELVFLANSFDFNDCWKDIESPKSVK